MSVCRHELGGSTP